jgi:hypothetical protein
MAMMSLVSMTGPISEIKSVINLLLESLLDRGLEVVLEGRYFVFQTAKEHIGTAGDAIPERMGLVRCLECELLQCFSIRKDESSGKRHKGESLDKPHRQFTVQLL